MHIKQISLKNSIISNNVFLAPMAGYTDFAFRSLSLENGYGLCFTELISAKGLVLNPKNNPCLWECGGAFDRTAVQIFGADPFYMRKACESEMLEGYKIIDINMGCPVPKVFKNGEGSALLKDIKKAESVVSECVKSGKTITVKIRIGQTDGDDVAAEFAKMAENAGASLVTVHGRVREAYYSGEPNYNAIARAKRAVNVPVIANGGIFTVSDAEVMMKETGADGVMLARGGIANPFLVCELLDIESKKDLKSFILSHLSAMRDNYGEVKAGMEFKKFAPWYFKGKLGVRELKNKINLAKTATETLNLIEKYL